MCAEVPPDARGRRRPLRRVSVSKVILKVQVRAGSLHPRLVPVHMWGSRVYGYFIDLIAADET